MGSKSMGGSPPHEDGRHDALIIGNMHSSTNMAEISRTDAMTHAKMGLGLDARKDKNLFRHVQNIYTVCAACTANGRWRVKLRLLPITHKYMCWSDVSQMLPKM